MSERHTEHHGIRAGAVLAFIGALAVTIVVVAAAMHVLTSHWNTRMAGANAPMDVRIPAPALESAPQDERARYVAEKEALLRSYGWVDRDKGIARIPIEDAMSIISGEPPAPPAAPTDEKKESTSSFTPQSSMAPETVLAVADVVQHPGAFLPLDAIVSDDTGKQQPLARYFGRSPVVLVFGYYRCRTLCTTMMEGVLQALSASRLDPSAYEVVGVSIDPRETAQDAVQKAQLYRAAYEGTSLQLLTANAMEAGRLSNAAGVRYAYDAANDQYAHPLALIVAAPDGRISRYFPGVKFDARDLRLALVEASRGKVGTVSERIFLRCAHFDPRTGRYTVAALTFVRAGALLVVVLLLASLVWWRMKRGVD